ncbi:MAG: hypothetical protein P8N67_11990 [Pseudomonadales bacterium]|nr:hypothetical protein [Pseudomonadales bacterium]
MAIPQHPNLSNVLDNTTPDKLTCFGVAPPGDGFWTKVTLDRAKVRYPNWDVTPYQDALEN